MAIVLNQRNDARQGIYLPVLVRKDGAAYKCGKCSTEGVKLWREASTFSVVLVCESCLTGGNVFNEEGLMLSEYGMTDQYVNAEGVCFVPAVPDEEGIGYYWYAAATGPAVRWWRRLSLRKRELLAKDVKIENA